MKLIQITAGRGPTECCWVVAQVLKKLLAEATDVGLTYQLIDKVKGDINGTLNSALIELQGDNVAAFLKQWTGTIQWIGQSRFRINHKRKNWFIGISTVEISTGYHFNEADFCYRAIRSGGPGGQHVNKVSTAIRATHLPSGLSVVASDNRSQQQNRKQAENRLKQILYVKDLDAKREKIQAQWQNHNELERGSPVRVFKGTDFKTNKVNKSYKPKRQQLKQALRQNDLE